MDVVIRKHEVVRSTVGVLECIVFKKKTYEGKGVNWKDNSKMYEIVFGTIALIIEVTEIEIYI